MESIDTDFPILENKKSPEIVPHILKEAAQIPLIKDREDYLKSWELEEEGTPPWYFEYIINSKLGILY